MRNVVALFELAQEMLRRSEYEHSVRDAIALTAILVSVDRCESQQSKKTPQNACKCDSEGGETD